MNGTSGGQITVTAQNESGASQGLNDYTGTDPTNGGNTPNGNVLAFLFLCVKSTATGSATVSVSGSPTQLTPDYASTGSGGGTYTLGTAETATVQVIAATTAPSTTMSIVASAINPVSTSHTYSVPVDLTPGTPGGPGIESANAVIVFDESYINPGSITVSEGSLLTSQGISPSDSGIQAVNVNPLSNTGDTYGTSQNLGTFTLSLDIANAAYLPSNASGSLWIITFTTQSSVSTGSTGLTTALNLVPSLTGTSTNVKDSNSTSSGYPLGYTFNSTIGNSPSDGVDGQITFNAVSSASTSTTLVSSQPTATYGAPPSFTATVTNTSGQTGTPTGSVAFVDETTGDTLDTESAASGTTSTTSTWTFAPGATQLNSTNIVLDTANTIEAIYAPTGTFLASPSNPTVTQVINQATLTPSITANGKTYDGGTTVTLTSQTVATTFGSDVVSLEVGASSFTSKSAGLETVTATGLSLGGSSAADYTLSSTTASTTAVIAQATLTPSITANGRTYNGGTTVTLASETVATTFGSDQVSLEVGASSFTSRSAGTETVTATGLSLGGSDAANYTLSSTTASTTATIIARPITVTAAAWDKVYDGGTSAPGAVPTVTGGSLVGTDTLDYSESFSSRNAMSSSLLNNPLGVNQQSGSVSDGNGGANYSVTFQPSTAGAILPLPITVTAATWTKPYDGTTSAAGASPEISISPSLVGGDTPDFIETFNTPAVGTGKTLTPSGSVIDGVTGLASGNYSVTLASVATGAITQAASHFVVTAITAGPVTAGANFLLLVEAEDSSNSIVASYAGSPTLSSTDPKVLTLPGTLNFTSGYAYTLASLETVAGGPWTITATDATNPADKITGASNSIAVSNASPSQVVLSAIANTSAGTAIGVTATVEDAYGNPVLVNPSSGLAVSYSVTLTASGGTAMYNSSSKTAPAAIPTATTSSLTGQATFSSAYLHQAGSCTLTASAALPGGINALTATSNSFNVSSGAAAQLVFTTQPPADVAGAKTFTAGVTVEDLYGNAVTGDDSSVTVSLQKAATYTGDSNGLLSSTGGTLTADYQDSGVAAFSGLSISQPGTGYSAAGSGYYLKASDPAVSSPAYSNDFNTTLIVTGVSMTSTGFTAAFSEPVDPADVNLYGAQSLPSVTLTGEYTEGQVHGSLVLDSTTAYLAISADSITESGTTVTVITTQAIHFTVGDAVTISGVTSEPATDVPAGQSDPATPYNGSFIITSVSGSTFQYTDVAGLPPISPAAEGVPAGTAVDTGNTMTFVATTLVKNSGLPIAGVSSADSTSAILVPDTYLVYFASGSSAFTTLNGQALDGPDSTGFSPAPSASSGASYRQPVYGPYSEPITIGPSDFTANETVDGGAYATPTDLAVIVPAFARGPGNAVNLPNSSGPIYSLVDHGGTVTVTTAVQDQASNGQQVLISGLTGAYADYDGTWTILSNTNYGGSPPAGHLPFSSAFTFTLPAGTPQLLNTSGGSFSVLTGIPISLSDTGGVTQATFTLSYNPTLLNIASTTATTSVINSGLAGTGATFTVTANNTTGVATIVFDDAAGLAGPGGGPIVLGSLTANVPATAVDAYRAKDLLTLSVDSISGEDLLGNPLVPGVNALGSQAVHVVAFLGDATGDGTLDSSDVGLMEDVLGDVTAGFNAYKLADPAIIGDIQAEGYVSLVDGNDLINYVNGGYGSNAHTVVYLPPYPTGLGTIVSTGPDPTVSLPSALQVGADGSLTVPVSIDDPLPAANDGMTEATLALTYDPAVFSVSSSDIHLGSVPASGSGWTLQSTIDQATGQIAVTILSTAPIASSAAGSLVTIDFHQIGLTAAGTTTIDLVGSVDPNGSAPTYTQVDGQQGPYVLSPAPANAYHPQIDALVTLAGAEGATGSAEGATGSAEGATGSAEGATGSAEGATGSAEGATGSAEGATGSASALPQLTVSVVAGPVAPVSAAAAVEALGPVSSVGVASRASASAGAAQVPQQLADGLFTALARGAVDPAELAILDSDEDEAVSQALAAEISAAGSAQANLDNLLWGDDGEAGGWDFTRQCRLANRWS